MWAEMKVSKYKSIRHLLPYQWENPKKNNFLQPNFPPMQIRRMDKHHREAFCGRQINNRNSNQRSAAVGASDDTCMQQAKTSPPTTTCVQYVHVQQPMNVTARKHQTLYRQALIFQLIIMHAGAEKGAAAAAAKKHQTEEQCNANAFEQCSLAKKKKKKQTTFSKVSCAALTRRRETMCNLSVDDGHTLN